MRMVAIALGMMSASPATAEPQRHPEEARIGRAIAAMAASAARLDADAFMAWYWKSPALAITFDGKTMRGWDVILAEQRKWWSDKNAGTTFAERRPAEITYQGAGVATSLQWMTVTTSAGAKPAELVITSVWKKRPEGWRIVLAHESLVP